MTDILRVITDAIRPNSSEASARRAQETAGGQRRSRALRNYQDGLDERRPREGESFAMYADRTRDLPASVSDAQVNTSRIRRHERDGGALRVEGQNSFRGSYTLSEDSDADREQRDARRERDAPVGPREGYVDPREARNAPPDIGEPQLTDDQRARVGYHEGGVVRQIDYATYAEVATGAPVNYMRLMTAHESGGDPNAKNSRSTATGTAQFIDSTWLRMLREHGSDYGLDQRLVRAIDSDNRVRDPEIRQRLLDMRRDPRWSAVMGGQYARENADVLSRRLGRPVTVGEVYFGHFAGGEVAARWIQVASTRAGREGNARALLRRIYARNPGQAAEIIAANPTIYTESATVGSVLRNRAQGSRQMTERFATAPPARRIAKQLMSSRDIAGQTLQQQNDETFNSGNSRERRDPLTGEVILDTPEERRRREGEEARIAADARRRGQTQWSLSDDGVGVRIPLQRSRRRN